MREVTSFVVVFPQRLDGVEEERAMLLQALRREYPHFEFEAFPGRGDDEFGIIPVIGEVGSHEAGEAGRVYMRKPLDPRVIPDLVDTLRVCSAVGAAA
ncbi:MAG TPA: hypothetical protein VN036_00555 [Devosia sp.]|nr:hypothetical protein [Devosia sp.]